ncbi:hypothetical protein CGLO_07472 [Colletotrichum gloeosporioides Cg-14]|uniref:Uncharacterized protein n=1 Tax=Colletotrichum gloeosporioides (strain Cg-14) TaxID=1237896 RepID=T0KJ31_COLGC|nr:hypothetical protein CGLO_07472 [Colletotrichum gloeosporioides Cg-14]
MPADAELERNWAKGHIDPENHSENDILQVNLVESVNTPPKGGPTNDAMPSILA